MHQVSDGQRRRVQIFLGLIRPFKILLLDEVRPPPSEEKLPHPSFAPHLPRSTWSLSLSHSPAPPPPPLQVTVSLDVVVRQDLLRWLRRESETRGATILYATHIFDGLDDWPTHLHYLCNKVQANPFPFSSPFPSPHRLLSLSPSLSPAPLPRSSGVQGHTGWQGKIGDLELYKKLRSEVVKYPHRRPTPHTPHHIAAPQPQYIATVPTAPAPAVTAYHHESIPPVFTRRRPHFLTPHLVPPFPPTYAGRAEPAPAHRRVVAARRARGEAGEEGVRGARGAPGETLAHHHNTQTPLSIVASALRTFPPPESPHVTAVPPLSLSFFSRRSKSATRRKCRPSAAVASSPGGWLPTTSSGRSKHPQRLFSGIAGWGSIKTVVIVVAGKCLKAGSRGDER